MKLGAHLPATARGRSGGFSTVELVVSLAVIFIASAIAIPSIMKTLRSYQLSDRASQVAGIIKLTRFDAIRRNRQVPFSFQQSGAMWTIWDDSDGNGLPGPNEAQMILSGDIGLLGAGSAPSPANLNSGIGPGTNVTPISGSNGSVYFDQRGAVVTAGGAQSAAVQAIYLGNAADPSYGYRAVIVMPSGAVEVWASSSAGDWRLLS